MVSRLWQQNFVRATARAVYVISAKIQRYSLHSDCLKRYCHGYRRIWNDSGRRDARGINNNITASMKECEPMQLSIMEPDALGSLCNVGLIPRFPKHCSNSALIAWQTSAIEGSEQVALLDAGCTKNPLVFLQAISSNEIS